MIEKHNKASGIGLERLCAQDWVQSTDTEYGVEFFEAWFQGNAYQKHRHDTYAICLTTAGILAFDKRLLMRSYVGSGHHSRNDE